MSPRAIAKSVFVVVCCAVPFAAPQAGLATCTPHSARPMLIGNQVLAMGSVACDVGTTYRYDLCLDAWRPASAGRGAWMRLSCSQAIAWHGSVRASRTAGPRAGVFRSDLMLMFPGGHHRTTVSANVGLCGPGAKLIPLGRESSSSFATFVRAHPRCALP